MGQTDVPRHEDTRERRHRREPDRFLLGSTPREPAQLLLYHCDQRLGATGFRGRLQGGREDEHQQGEAHTGTGLPEDVANES